MAAGKQCKHLELTLAELTLAELIQKPFTQAIPTTLTRKMAKTHEVSVCFLTNAIMHRHNPEIQNALVCKGGRY